MPIRPKYQVFVSSTYKDLRVEREAVTWALLSARHIPVGMEAFTATKDRGWKTIRSAIDRSDYYVLLVAGRYGTTDEDGLSWTQKEYDYATSRGIPTLVFIRAKSAITADQMEDAPLPQERLEAFKSLLRQRHHCVEWNGEDDLVSHVNSALTNHILDDEDGGAPRPGWYRGDEIPASATLDEFARLSAELSRLQTELESLRAAREKTPSLAIADRHGLPVCGSHTVKRTFKCYHKAIASLQECMAVSYGKDVLGLNAFVTLEPAITNVGGLLIEHVVVDLKLEGVLGFFCGRWSGRELVQSGGRMSSNTIRPEYRGEYPDSARLDGPDCVSLRFRLDRIAVGATEYLPPILVIGKPVGDSGIEFSVGYSVAGSVGLPVVGRCIRRLEIIGCAPVDGNAKRDDESAIRRLFGPIDWSGVFLVE